MRVTDMFLAFPALILALAINAALGRGLTQAMLAVAISWWPSYARLVRCFRRNRRNTSPPPR